jgi:hypothetical protein
MPSRGQNGGAMKESFAQHSAQTPTPSTGSRQATHSVGKAMSSAIRAARDMTFRSTSANERDEGSSASIAKT